MKIINRLVNYERNDPYSSLSPSAVVDSNGKQLSDSDNGAIHNESLSQMKDHINNNAVRPAVFFVVAVVNRSTRKQNISHWAIFFLHLDLVCGAALDFAVM